MKKERNCVQLHWLGKRNFYAKLVLTWREDERANVGVKCLRVSERWTSGWTMIHCFSCRYSRQRSSPSSLWHEEEIRSAVLSVSNGLKFEVKFGPTMLPTSSWLHLMVDKPAHATLYFSLQNNSCTWNGLCVWHYFPSHPSLSLSLRSPPPSPRPHPVPCPVTLPLPKWVCWHAVGYLQVWRACYPKGRKSPVQLFSVVRVSFGWYYDITRSIQRDEWLCSFGRSSTPGRHLIGRMVTWLPTLTSSSSQWTLEERRGEGKGRVRKTTPLKMVESTACPDWTELQPRALTRASRGLLCRLWPSYCPLCYEGIAFHSHVQKVHSPRFSKINVSMSWRELEV